MKQAWPELRRPDEIVVLEDDLGFGPINPPSGRLRSDWYNDELGHDREDLVTATPEFWAAVTTAVNPIVWMSRRRVSEYTGFLEVLRCRGDAPLRVVDITDVEFIGRNGLPDPRTSMAFAFVGSDRIIAQGLFETARRLSLIEADAYRTCWQRLRAENSPLRVLDATGLVSTPITYFDDLIVSCAAQDWQRCSQLLGASLDRINEIFNQTADAFLCARIYELIERNRLEGRGNFLDIRDTSVRRA